MILAAIGAVQGNFSALERVLQAVDDEGIEILCCTGNLVAGNKDGAKVIETLVARDAFCVQGTEDKLVVRARRKAASLRRKMSDAEVEALLQAHASLRSDQIEWLRGLPPRRALEIDQHPIVLCHGSLTSQWDPIDADTPEYRLERQREIAPVDLVICGGAMSPFARHLAGTLFVNPGPLMREGQVCWALVDLETPPYQAAFYSA